MKKINFKIIIPVFLIISLLVGCSSIPKINIDNQLNNAKSITYDESLATKNDDFVSLAADNKNSIINYARVSKDTKSTTNFLPVDNMFNNMVTSDMDIYGYTWTVNNLMDKSKDYNPCIITLNAKLTDPKNFDKSKQDIRKIFDNILSEYNGFIYTQNIYAYSESGLKSSDIALITKINNIYANYYITFEAGYTPAIESYFVSMYIFDLDATFNTSVSGVSNLINTFKTRMNSVKQNISVKIVSVDPYMGYIIDQQKTKDQESEEDKIIKNRIIFK